MKFVDDFNEDVYFLIYVLKEAIVELVHLSSVMLIDRVNFDILTM